MCHIRLTIFFIFTFFCSSAQYTEFNPPSGVTAPIAPDPFSFPANYPSGVKVNWVRTTALEKAITDTSLIPGLSAANKGIVTSFSDGLGRNIQTVLQQASPANDIVSIAFYDSCGKQNISPLPYNSGTNYGGFKKNALSEQAAYYTALYPEQNRPFSVTNDQYGPMRVIETPPGGGFGQVRTTHLRNVEGDNIRIWDFVASGTPPTTSWVYVENMLSVVQKEDYATTRQFFDAEGKLIATRQNVDGGTTWASTYYVYDKLNRLRAVIPPLAVNYLSSHSWSFGSSGIYDELCYRYDYDNKGRCTMRKMPSLFAVNIVYDTLDRPVLMQDGNQSILNDWLFIKYDVLGRKILTGNFLNAPAYSATDLRSLMASSTSSNAFIDFLKINTFANNYDSSSIIPDAEIYTINYYDVYNKLPSYYSYSAAAMAAMPPDISLNAVTEILSKETRTLPTGGFVRIMDGHSVTSRWESRATYYDPKGKPIQVQSRNFKNGLDTVTIRYDFSGSPVSTISAQYNPAASCISKVPRISICKAYSYDDNKRLIATYQKTNNEPNFLQVNEFTYDNIGRLSQKKYGSIEVQKYKYRIWGDLQSINEDFYNTASPSRYFGEVISYDYGFSHHYGNLPCGMKWRMKGSPAIQRAYGYMYDFQGRLSYADYNQTPGWDKTTENYSNNHISYDANGNLLTMQQWGTAPGYSAPFLMDNLTYNYATPGLSNKLKSVDDAISTNYGLGEFYQQAGTTGTDYYYDANGNAIKDANKNIMSIGYNYLNKPYIIQYTGDRNITFTYDAAGTLLSKKIEEPGHPTQTIDYVGGLEYHDNKLYSVAHAEGRARPVALVPPGTTDTTMYFEYDFFIKDHQQNVRSVVTQVYDEGWFSPGMGTMTRTPPGGNNPIVFSPGSLTIGTRQYMATCELRNAQLERATFSNIDSTRAQKPNTTDTADVLCSKLNAATNATIGPGIVLRIMAGDSIGISADAYYEDSTSSDSSYTTTSAIVSSLLTALSGGVLSGTLGEGGVAMSQESAAVISAQLSSAMNALQSYKNPNKPQAFLNYIILDDNLHPVANGSGFLQVTSPGKWGKLIVPDFPVAESGYLIVFPSDESHKDVFFDNVSIAHYKGSLQAENHYYPYGLTLTTNAVTMAASNDILYRSNKLHHNEFSDNKGLDWYYYNARFYDPQIGRWHSSDPLADQQEQFSPYHYCFGNPVVFTDPSGLRPKQIYHVWGGFGDCGSWVPKGGIGYGLNDFGISSWLKECRTSLNWTNGYNLNTLINSQGGIRSEGGEQYIGNVSLNSFLEKALSGYSDLGQGLSATLGGGYSDFLKLTGIRNSPTHGWGYWSNSNTGSSKIADAGLYNGGGGNLSTNLSDFGMVTKWNASTVGSNNSWYDDIGKWWNSKDLYFKLGGEVSAGIQGGMNLELFGKKFGGSLNLASVKLLTGSVSQQKNDLQPYVLEGNYIGKKSIYSIFQGVRVGWLGFEHSFDTKGYGYIDGTDIIKGGINPFEGDSGGTINTKVELEAALFLGIKISVEYGVKDK